VLKNKKKRQVIKTLTLKQKVKHHYMKQDDGVCKIDKEQNNYLFLFFVNKFLLFSVSRMKIEESFFEKLQKQSAREMLQKLREEK
jgi:hypothetical protein